MSPSPSCATHIIVAASKQAEAVARVARACRGRSGVAFRQTVAFLASDTVRCITGGDLTVSGAMGVHARA